MLCAGNAILDNAAGPSGGNGISNGDYYTEQEAAAKFAKPKKKKVRKIRTKKADHDALGIDLDALEAEAAAMGTNDLGSKAAKAEAQQRKLQVSFRAAFFTASFTPFLRIASRGSRRTLASAVPGALFAGSSIARASDPRHRCTFPIFNLFIVGSITSATMSSLDG